MEVEKQMPKKYEHVMICRLSKRQRFLYDEYMSRTKYVTPIVGLRSQNTFGSFVNLFRKNCLFQFYCIVHTLNSPDILYTITYSNSIV